MQQGLYLNEAGRRKFLQGVNVGRILAFNPTLISQTENQRDLITKTMAMFSAIKRVVRENIAGFERPSGWTWCCKCSANRLETSQCGGQFAPIQNTKT